MSNYLPTDHHLMIAEENIRLAQLVQKRELEEKDETINSLRKKVDTLHSQCRHLEESKHLSDKGNREILSQNKFIARQLTVEQANNVKLKEEINALKQELTNISSALTDRESDLDKANHIIKELLKQIRKDKQLD